MSDYRGALAKLVLRKVHIKTNSMKRLKFSTVKAVHDCYQCWKFELKIPSDGGNMHFLALEPRGGVIPFLTPQVRWQGYIKRQNYKLNFQRSIEQTPALSGGYITKTKTSFYM